MTKKGKLNTEQTKGRFRVPKSVEMSVSPEDDPCISSWLDDNQGILPIAINNGRYSPEGVTTKLGADKELVERLLLVGILRTEEGMITPVSLGQAISWKYKKNIQDVLVSQDRLPVEPEERISILFSAYSGCDDFDKIVQECSGRSFEGQRIRAWQRIPVKTVPETLVLDYENIPLLIERGLLIPRMDDYKGVQLNELVDPISVAVLASLLYNADKDEIFMPENSKAVHEAAERFVRYRIKQFLIRNKIVPLKRYSIGDASKRLCRQADSFNAGIEEGLLPYIEIKNSWGFLGLDLALYCMRDLNHGSTPKDLSKITCASLDELASMGFRGNGDSGATEIYDRIASAVFSLTKDGMLDLPEVTHMQEAEAAAAFLENVYDIPEEIIKTGDFRKAVDYIFTEHGSDCQLGIIKRSLERSRLVSCVDDEGKPVKSFAFDEMLKQYFQRKSIACMFYEADIQKVDRNGAIMISRLFKLPQSNGSHLEKDEDGMKKLFGKNRYVGVEAVLGQMENYMSLKKKAARNYNSVNKNMVDKAIIAIIEKGYHKN